MMTNADRRMILLRINILYASPPDLKPGNGNDDASHEYAKRAWEYFQRKQQQQQQKEQKNSTCSATNIRFGTISMGQLTYLDPQISTTDTPTSTTTTSIPGLPPYCGMIVEETYGREPDDAIASSSSSSNDASSSSPRSTSTSRMIQDVNLMLLSCTADGSVNRSVRKILRALSKEKKSPPPATAAATARGSSTTTHTTATADDPPPQPQQQAVVVVDQTHKIHTITTTGCGLLGHARCDNSAKQMAETIFQSGRKFEKQVAAYGGGSQTTTTTNPMPSRILPRLETQVELIGPEVEFDPWLATILTTVLEASR